MWQLCCCACLLQPSPPQTCGSSAAYSVACKKVCCAVGNLAAQHLGVPPLQVAGGHTKRMDQLAIGDSVLAVDAGTGALSYQPVYFFGHRLRSNASRFVSLRTSSGGHLRLTSGHHMPLCTTRL